MASRRRAAIWGWLSLILGLPSLVLAASTLVLLPHHSAMDTAEHAARILWRLGPIVAQFGLGVFILYRLRVSTHDGAGSQWGIVRAGWWTLASTLVSLVNAGYMLLILVSTAPPWATGNARARSDLKNLAMQQEMYFTSHGSYSADKDSLVFVATNGITVTMDATLDGWSAVARFASGPSCALYWGEVGHLPSTRWSIVPGHPGEIACDGTPVGRLGGYRNFLRRMGGPVMSSHDS